MSEREAPYDDGSEAAGTGVETRVRLDLVRIATAAARAARAARDRRGLLELVDELCRYRQYPVGDCLTWARTELLRQHADQDFDRWMAAYPPERVEPRSFW